MTEELLRPAWMDPKQQELSIKKGDQVVIHHPDLRYPLQGDVLSVDPIRRMGYITSWYIELTCNSNCEGRTAYGVVSQGSRFHCHGYHYWKQGERDQKIDGGWVEMATYLSRGFAR